MLEDQFRTCDSGLAGRYPRPAKDTANLGRFPRTSRLHEIIKLSLAL